MSPGFWKANFDNEEASAWTVESDNPLVSSVFVTSSSDLNGDGVDDTLRDALSYNGGDGAEGAERNLLRHAVAAKLNIENEDVAYSIVSVDDLKNAVNTAIASGERVTMNDLKDELDVFNNLGCPINIRGDQSTD